MPDSLNSSPPWLSLAQEFLSSNSERPLIVVVGPTGSGKTAFSIRLCKALAILRQQPEVINADSRQLYKHLDIGTAKITPEEMEGIPHHLLSVLDPKQECSIAWFQEKGRAVISELHQQGRLPVLVGGSMLYISALIDGYEPVASPDPELRARLTQEYDCDGGVCLMKRLQEVDPESASRIPIQNKMYLIRALEIWETTGTKKSERVGKSGSPYQLLMFGMKVDPDALQKRVTDRTIAMLEGGWVEEVKLLRELGYGHEDPGMESHGYREILASLERQDFDLQKLAKDITTKTRQYAKRSLTWWKRDPRIHWIDPQS